MKRDDSVFFFTLVDFLLTALFFGIVLFAVARVRETKERETRAELASMLDTLVKTTGISDLTELTDQLTRLGPLRPAVRAVELVRQAGGPRAAEKALVAVFLAGGADTVQARLERLRLREGTGKPHCLFTEERGRKEAIVLATVTGTDSSLTFARETPELKIVLARLNKEFSDVRVMQPAAFRRTFAELLSLQPNCLYTINFVERTQYVHARDAARGIFYMRIDRR